MILGPAYFSNLIFSLTLFPLLSNVECVAATRLTDGSRVGADPRPADRAAFPPRSAGVLELRPEVHLPAAQPRSSPAPLIIRRAVPLLFYSCRPRSFCFFNNWNVPLLCLGVQPRFYLCISSPPLVIW